MTDQSSQSSQSSWSSRSPAGSPPDAPTRRPEPEGATVTAVVPSYNVAPLLERCLASLRQGGAELRVRGDSLATVVVDNASADGSADLVRRRFPGVALVANPDNRGFGAACNQGAAGA